MLILYKLPEPAGLEGVEGGDAEHGDNKVHRIAVGDTSDLNTAVVAFFDSLSWGFDERNAPAHCKCNTYRRSDCVHGIGVVFRIAKSCTAAEKVDD